MTVPSTQRRAGPFNGNGVTTSFPFTFKVFAAEDVEVVKTGTNALETTLVLNSDYSVSMNLDQDASPGGTITYPISGSPLGAGEKLTLIGNLDYEQTTNLTQGGAFSPTVIEDTFDRTVIQIQQLEEEITRALRMSVSTTASGELPAAEAGKLIGWDQLGAGFANYDAGSLFSGAVYADWKYSTFTGDGSTVAYVLQQSPGNIANMDVSVGGVTQIPMTDYTLSGSTVNFTTAPPNGAPILLRYGQAAQQVSSTFSIERQTATASQTVFNLTSASYLPGSNNLSVFVNGLKAISGVDFTETDSDTVTFASGLTAGDELEFVCGRTLNDAVGSESVSFKASASTPTRSVQSKLRDVLNAKDYGVVGDGVSDDTVTFAAACAAAVAAKTPLDISDLKIYLASQATSIPSDGLYLVGSGYLKGQVAGGDIDCITVDWLYEAGTSGRFAINKATMSAFKGSVIFSQYNGPIFTGKTFSGENFTVIGDPLFTNNQCFKQTTPTSYPGWSQPFMRLKDFSCAYFGGHGLEATGGSELTKIKNVSSMFSKGYCLYIGQTNGVNCPIEYVDIDGGWYAGGLLGNIYLEGVSKQIQIRNTTQLAPGQLPRRASGGFTVATRSDIVFPIRLRPAPGALIISAVDISIHDNVGEETQGLVSLQDALSGFPYWYDVDVRDNYLIPYNNTWPFYNFQIDGTFAVNVTTTRNFTPSGVRMYFVPSANHSGFDIQERFTGNGVTIDGALLNDSQYIRPRIYPGDSGSLGDGTAGYFQTTIFADSFATPSNKAAVPTLYLISADNQGTGVGAYLLAAFRTNSGQWYGTTCAFGSTSGFNGAPGILTNGAIFANTNVNYRVRVKRIDMGVVNPATY